MKSIKCFVAMAMMYAATSYATPKELTDPIFEPDQLVHVEITRYEANDSNPTAISGFTTRLNATNPISIGWSLPQSKCIFKTGPFTEEFSTSGNDPARGLSYNATITKADDNGVEGFIAVEERTAKNLGSKELAKDCVVYESEMEAYATVRLLNTKFGEKTTIPLKSGTHLDIVVTDVPVKKNNKKAVPLSTQ